LPVDEVPEFFRPDGALDDPQRWLELKPIRRYITKVGAEQDWAMAASHREPVPFDEPVLGIVGMWRQGYGADPHFALALGETMLRVGQRYLAWAAYERAARLADRFWPDPALQQFLREHCRKRQAQIEATLSFQPSDPSYPAWQHVSPPPGAEAVANLRPAFDAELAHGEGYQRAYQQYEAEKIAAGVAITQEGFYDAFHAGREPIASAVGSEEWFAYVPRAKMYRCAAERRFAWSALGAGLAAFATAVGMRWWTRRSAAASDLPQKGTEDTKKEREIGTETAE
jgi:hypothetical protein